MEQYFKNEYIELYNVFNEPEILCHSHLIEPTFSSIKRHAEHMSNSPFILEPVDAYIPLDTDSITCTVCKGTMTRHNREFTFFELDIIPEQLKARNYVRYVYICHNCPKKGKNIKRKTTKPYPLLKKSVASPDTIAYLIRCKYIELLPLREIEKTYFAANLPISRNIISSWIISTTMEMLLPFYEMLKNELLKNSTILHSKIKPKILRNEYRLLKPDITIWIYKKPDDCEKPIILYTYSTKHNGFPPHKFVKHYDGELIYETSFLKDFYNFTIASPDTASSKSYDLSENNMKWVLADNYKNCSDLNTCCYVIYSIIKTAEVNKIEPYEYLKYLLRNLAFRNKKSVIKESRDLLPWFYEKF